MKYFHTTFRLSAFLLMFTMSAPLLAGAVSVCAIGGMCHSEHRGIVAFMSADQNTCCDEENQADAVSEHLNIPGVLVPGLAGQDSCHSPDKASDAGSDPGMASECNACGDCSFQASSDPFAATKTQIIVKPLQMPDRAIAICYVLNRAESNSELMPRTGDKQVSSVRTPLYKQHQAFLN